MGKSQKRKEESCTVDERMRNTFDCKPSIMEKEKSKLRKLKRGKGKVKQEEASKLNKQFHLDAGRVYSNV